MRVRHIVARLAVSTLLVSGMAVAESLPGPGAISGSVTHHPGQMVAAAPAVPGAPSLGSGSVRVLVDNDYALFLGDGTNATELRYQNDEEWSRQLDEATSVDISGGDGYVYLVAMGGGGAENFGGTINNVNLTTIAAMQRATSGATCGDVSDAGWFLMTGCITGYDSDFVAHGTQDVSLEELRGALTGATWGSMPSFDLLDGDVCYVGGQASFENGVATNTCYTTPSNQAVVVRFPVSAVRFPIAGNGQATIYWTAPTAGGVPTSYIARAHLASDGSLTGHTCSPTNLTDLQCTVTGLTNGTNYKFTVIALNEAGPSDPSPFTATLTPTGPVVPVVIPPLMEPAPPSVVPGMRPLPMGESEVVSCALGATTGCIAQSVTVEVQQQEFVIRSDEFTMRLSGECATTCGITSLEDGRQMLELESGGSVRVQGEGFLPVSEANVWLFSEPHLLGVVEADASGSFLGVLPIGPIAEGAHTIWVDAVGPDGRSRSVGLSIMIRPATLVTPMPDQVPDQVSELPQAGSAHGGTAVNWSLLFVTLGALLWLLARRPEQEFTNR
jgi:hypothetical protein